jgi:hypothetical protein
VSAVQVKLQGLIDRAFAAALAGDEPRWDEVVRAQGLTPLTVEQRALIRKAGVPKLKGVLPVELRVVLEAIRAQISLEPGAHALAMELKTFVDRELLRYVAAAQPPKAAMGNIFANAHASAVRMASADGISALRCSCCGAARPAGSELHTCSFCGAALL